MDGMVGTTPYRTSSMVAVIWCPASMEETVAGGASWREEVSSARWWMDPRKADRVDILVAIGRDDGIVGAWRVVGVESTADSDPGLGRRSSHSRSRFDLVDDPELGFLSGPSPWARTRQGQRTFYLGDIPGGPELVERQPDPGDGAAGQWGMVRLGQYTLAVSRDGLGILTVPPEGAITIRAAPPVRPDRPPAVGPRPRRTGGSGPVRTRRLRTTEFDFVLRGQEATGEPTKDSVGREVRGFVSAELGLSDQIEVQVLQLVGPGGGHPSVSVTAPGHVVEAIEAYYAV